MFRGLPQLKAFLSLSLFWLGQEQLSVQPAINAAYTANHTGSLIAAKQKMERLAVHLAAHLAEDEQLAVQLALRSFSFFLLPTSCSPVVPAWSKQCGAGASAVPLLGGPSPSGR